jgi:hypothetical protein
MFATSRYGRGKRREKEDGIGSDKITCVERSH